MKSEALVAPTCFTFDTENGEGQLNLFIKL